MRLGERIREGVAFLEHVRLVADLQLDRSCQHVDELHLSGEGIELIARSGAGGDDGLDRLEPLLVPRGEQVVLGREVGVDG